MAAVTIVYAVTSQSPHPIYYITAVLCSDTGSRQHVTRTKVSLAVYKADASATWLLVRVTILQTEKKQLSTDFFGWNCYATLC